MQALQTKVKLIEAENNSNIEIIKEISQRSLKEKEKFAETNLRLKENYRKGDI